MEWLKAGMVFMVLSSAVLGCTFFYVWSTLLRRRYVLLWALAWVAAIPHICFSWRSLSANATYIDHAAGQTLLVLNALLMLCGCLAFASSSRSLRAVLTAGSPFFLWAIISPAIENSPIPTSLPGSVLLGVSYLWAAYLFIGMSRERGTRGARVAAVLFTLAGIHEFDYPLLGHLPWFNTVGYFLAATLAIAIALCLLVMVLEDARADADRERSKTDGILQMLPVGVLVIGRDGELLVANDVARTTFALDQNRQNRSLGELEKRIFGDKTENGHGPIAKVLETGRPHPAQDLTIINSAGESRSALVNTGPVRDARGQLLGAVAVVQDIDEMKQMRAQMERDDRLKGLGTLAAGVSHDFNNALTMILGHAELAADTSTEPEVQEQLEVIRQVATDGAAIVRRIQGLAGTRVDRDHMVVDLSEIAQEVVELTRPRWRDQAHAEGKSYRLRTNLAHAITVRGDAAELREALLNLLLNALDAMPDGGELEIAVEQRHERAILRVRDTGQGMPEHVKSRAFDPFFTTKGSAGTGLGLAMVFGIVKQHSGTISVTSEPGNGTEFTIDLPVTTGSVAEPQQKQATPAMEPLRVLVIDDEPLIRSLTASLLTSAGHEVTTAADGPAGLAQLEITGFDVVLTDLSMPGMSGWQVADAVHEKSPETGVVLVTGWGDTVSSEQAESHGISTVLLKPFDRKKLLAAVASIPRPALSVGG